MRSIDVENRQILERALVDAAKSLNLPVIVDNTFATPYLYRPADDGAAVIIESLTKWIGGHGATIGGAVIDAGMKVIIAGAGMCTGGRIKYHLIAGDYVQFIPQKIM